MEKQNQNGTQTALHCLEQPLLVSVNNAKGLSFNIFHLTTEKRSANLDSDKEEHGACNAH